MRVVSHRRPVTARCGVIPMNARYRVRKDAPSTEQWRKLHAVADEMAPDMKDAFLRAIQDLKDRVVVQDLIDALSTTRVDIVLQVIGLDALNDKLSDLLSAAHDTYERGASVTAGQMPDSLGVLPAFDLNSPASINFLQNYDFNLVTGITDVTEAGVRAVVSNAFEYGGSVDEQARMIRNLVGLTDNQADAVLNYERMLTDDGAFSSARIEVMANAYAQRLLNQRGENIARTESIRAAGAGREAYWQQMVAGGTLNKNGVRRFWTVTDDDRLCPICSVIPKDNGDGVGLDEPFDVDGEDVMHEPAHPRCRCGVRIEYQNSSDEEQGGEE